MRYAIFLRAIANVPMTGFRAKLEGLGSKDVASFGMSGNFVLTAPRLRGEDLERRLTNEFGTQAFVRTKTDVKRMLDEDPFVHDRSTTLLLLLRPPPIVAKQALANLDLVSPQPVIMRRVLHAVYPVRRRGRKGSIDPEKVVGVPATFRSRRVIEGVLRLM